MAALPIPARELFINGRWVAPVKGKYLDVVCPANEAVIGRIPAGKTAGACADMHMIKTAAHTYADCC
jgi:acyl-CoA reductase-like NAD-dependent aldehyde dehydrogenase